MVLPQGLAQEKEVILGFLRRSPGIGLRQLARGVGFPPHRVRKAVAELEGEGRVVTFRFRNKLCHFLNREAHIENRHAIALLAQVKGLEDLYDHIATNPGLRQHEILKWAMARGWARSTTYWRLKELVTHELVMQHEVAGGVVVYQASDATA